MFDAMYSERLERLFDAVDINDSVLVKSILAENLNSIKKIPVRYIAGILIIATESSYIESIKEILDYNLIAPEKIDCDHMYGFYDLATKMNINSHFTHTLN